MREAETVWRNIHFFSVETFVRMVRTGAFFTAALTSQPPQLDSAGQRTEDTLTDWESTWRSQTKFCIFFPSIFKKVAGCHNLSMHFTSPLQQRNQSWVSEVISKGAGGKNQDGKGTTVYVQG